MNFCLPYLVFISWIQTSVDFRDEAMIENLLQGFGIGQIFCYGAIFQLFLPLLTTYSKYDSTIKHITIGVVLTR